jgi:GNAT superfamily N-acetyltransferase
MKTTHRNYVEGLGDFNRIAHFVIQHNAQIRNYSTWCLGRFLDWKYGLWGNKLSIPGFCEQNAQLWFDGFDELAGFAVSEDGNCDVAILTAAGYRFLFEDILNWVLANWGNRKPGLSIEITALQTLEAGLLERNGFQRQSSFYTSHFDLTAELPARIPLEDGFKIVDMHSHPDYRAQRILRADAFRNKSDYSEEEMAHELSVDAYARESPIYHPQTDVCVMAPDGSFAAGCEALIDAHNAEADIERVCTHSHYRRRGFGRVVIQECLGRLRAMGLLRAYITGYSPEAIALYGSLGAYKQTESLVYRLSNAQ